MHRRKADGCRNVTVFSFFQRGRSFKCFVFLPSGLVKVGKALQDAADSNDYLPMAHEHPFQHLFETLGRTPHAHAESVNRQAYEVLSDILTVPLEKSGRCILLRAPRAGHGKTHLLSRIQHQMGGTHEFIPLHASFGCRIDAASVIDDTLRCLVKQLPASGGLCVLDLITRRLFASALQPLVGSGEVPCQDREGALAALRMRPIETFDFHHPNAVTAHWARENFEVLGQRLSLELAQRADLPVREVAFWVEALFRFAAAPLDNSNRVRILADTVHEGTGGEMERLEALLGLVTQLMRVVLVADDLEGFSSDETAALRFAAFLGGLRQSVDRLDVILSLNLDIWESAFVPRLSGGLADRLSEVVVELDPLTETEMAALLDSRVPGLGSKVLERINLGHAGTHARGLIRAAGMAWLKATATDASPVVSSVLIPTPSFEPAPSVPVFVAPEPKPVAAEITPEPPAQTFTFAPETLDPRTSVAAEVAPSWPAPSFSPPPPVVIPEPTPAWNPPAAVTEPVIFQPPVESPSQVSPSGPVVPEPVIPEPVVFQPALQSPFQPPVESPFQNSAPEPIVPEPVISEPAVFQPALQSPFQAPVESPFQVSAPEPIVPEPVIEEPVAFQPAVQSPFQPAVHEPYTFNPPPSQTVYPPDTTSPFQSSPPQFTPSEPLQQSIVPQGSFQPAPHEPYAFNPPPPQPDFQPQAASVFQASPSPFQAAEVVPLQPTDPQASFQPVTPVFQAASTQPAAGEEEAPPPSTADTDRVDDLLRQFRERYGRGSL